jgi:hypothetical protein
VSGDPWFKDPGIGTLFLVPIGLKGWAALLLYVALLLLSIALPKDVAPPYCIGLTVGYLGLSFLKSRRA